MAEGDEYGPWIIHDGDFFPHGKYRPIQAEVVYETGTREVLDGHSGHCGGSFLVIHKEGPLIRRYRLRETKAMKMLTEIMQEKEDCCD